MTVRENGHAVLALVQLHAGQTLEIEAARAATSSRQDFRSFSSVIGAATLSSSVLRFASIRRVLGAGYRLSWRAKRPW